MNDVWYRQLKNCAMEDGEMSIKLGWYRSRDNKLYRVVHVRDDGHQFPIVGYSKNGPSFSHKTDVVSYWEYVGPELQPQGEWVDIDLSKVVLADLPIKARFRDCESHEWDEPNQLCAFEAGVDHKFRCQHCTGWKYCQIWRPL